MRAVPLLCRYYPVICFTTKEKSREILSQGSHTWTFDSKEIRFYFYACCPPDLERLQIGDFPLNFLFTLLTISGLDKNGHNLHFIRLVKLLNWPVSPSCMFVHLYACTEFHDIWYLNIYRTSVRKIQVSFKSDNNNGSLTGRLAHIFLLLLAPFL